MGRVYLVDTVLLIEAADRDTLHERLEMLRLEARGQQLDLRRGDLPGRRCLARRPARVQRGRPLAERNLDSASLAASLLHASADLYEPTGHLYGRAAQLGRADRARPLRARQPERDRPRPDRNREDDVHRCRDEPLLPARHSRPRRRPARRLPAPGRPARRHVRRPRRAGGRAQPVRPGGRRTRRLRRQAGHADPPRDRHGRRLSPRASGRPSTAPCAPATRRPASVPTPPASGARRRRWPTSPRRSATSRAARRWRDAWSAGRPARWPTSSAARRPCRSTAAC